MAENKTNLIFTNWSIDTGVFFEEDTFCRLGEIDDAIENAKTWGEFRELLPNGVFEQLPFWHMRGGEKIFSDGTNYYCIDPSKLEDFLRFMEGEDDSYIIKHSDQLNIMVMADHDHPMWVVGQARNEFPEEFNERFASHTGHPASGSWTEFPMAEYEEMKDCLSNNGFSVRMVEYNL